MIGVARFVVDPSGRNGAYNVFFWFDPICVACILSMDSVEPFMYDVLSDIQSSRRLADCGLGRPDRVCRCISTWEYPRYIRRSPSRY